MMKKVIDVMNKELVTIEPRMSFDDILKLMIEKKIGKLPVVEDEKLIGVVTRNDILIRQETAPLPPMIAFWDLLITLPKNKEFEDKLKKMSAIMAKEIMSTEYLVVKKDDELAIVVTKIVDGDYNYALVVEDEILKGIITKTDLVNKCFN
jgi:CBS domain-containing protein